VGLSEVGLSEVGLSMAAFAPVAPPVPKLFCIGLLPDAVKPGIHGVRTRWIRGFMAF
jgi:hypothetical protein